MGYRIEFFTSDNARRVVSPLGDQRFPSFVAAISAARTAARDLRQANAPVMACIFDRQERLASTMKLLG